MALNEQVVQLPHLTDEELEQLFLAVQVRIEHMRAITVTTESEPLLSDARHALNINLSLLTAISEARMSLER